ncbi:MAG: BamA/TamA family outer membrane protein [Legionellaceae bacterium]|nr:BamA/TamA family outer membrane protein [Legionellaceae bacterium]
MIHRCQFLYRLKKYSALILLLLAFACFPPLLHATLPNVTIKGVSGPLLLNVEYRLGEMYKGKSIVQQPEEELRKQVANALYPYGYFKPEISIHRVTRQLKIYIKLGPQLHITSVNIRVIGEGARNPDIQQTLRNLPLKIGQPFDTVQYNDAKDTLLNCAEHQGYLRAAFDTSQLHIDQSRYTADITWVLNTGPRSYFGQIRFDPTYISPELLHRYVPFKFGQPYSTDKVLQLNSNLASSNYFKVVNVKPTITTSQFVPLEINLQSKQPIQYSVGMGYGTDTGARGRLGLNVIPVNSAGHKFKAIAQGSIEQNTIQGQYIIPGTNPINDNYNINGGLTNLHYNAGRSNSIHFGLAQQHLTQNFQRTLSLNGLNERYNYTGFPDNTETILFPKAVFTWSKTDEILFSPSGYKITAIGLAASTALLSQVSLFQSTVDARAALTVDAIRTRFYLHAIQSFTAMNNVYQLPLSLAQLLGGAENLKGYSFNSIGPGKITSYGGLEIQKETVHKLYLLGFMDAGDVYNPSLKKYQYDAGVGIMWVSPVGPIKIAMAQAITGKFERIPNHSPKLVVNMGPDL